MSFRFLGTGMYVPEKIVTNDDMAQIVETSDEWISQRVGVKQRHISTNETAADMGASAAMKALEDSETSPQELDMIIAASVSGETTSPSVACMIQQKIGASCIAFDVSAACAGFLFVLETASAFFKAKAGSVKKVLVVGAERISRLLDWSDRSTCVIFGDGAGAAVLGEGDNYVDSTFTVKGGDDVIKIPNSHGISPFWTGDVEKPFIHMNGQETFKFAVNSITTDIKNLLERNNVSKDEISLIVPHQANSRIIDFASRKLGIPLDKFYMNIDRYGNTSSASVPMALDEANRKGMLKRGDKIVLTAFGGGLASASSLITW